MLSMEYIPSRNIKKPRYRIYDSIDHGSSTIAIVDGLLPAACVLRFLKGSRLEIQEYKIALATMAEIDARGGGENNEG